MAPEILEIIAIALASILLLISATLATEIVCAALSRRSVASSATQPSRPSTAILIPANNEEKLIARIVGALTPQLRDIDTLLVVADNCDDETADIARMHGAIVIERHEPQRRGKGYAIGYGIDYLRRVEPEVVVVVDADCVVAPDSIDILSNEALSSGRPVQAVNLIEVAADAPVLERIGAFAFKVKNYVRPLGLKRLGLPCPLTGTGMAFPWTVIEDAPLASGHIVEDLKLGIDLAADGHPATFDERASVMSQFPRTELGREIQHRRWEHGHLAMIVSDVPRLIYLSFRKRQSNLIAIALDLMVPPISFLVVFLGLMDIGTFVLWLFGSTGKPLIISLTATGLTALSLSLAWCRFGRDLLPIDDLHQVPLYVIRKLPLYFTALIRREKKWVRGNQD